MPRRTVWIPEELDALVLEELPGINWSAALQAGVRELLGCEHHDLTCSSCGACTTTAAIAGEALERFYRAVMGELGQKVAQPGYEGAARIVRRLAADHAVPGTALVPVPRATRANHEARAELTPLPLEADSRRRHPTAHPIPHNQPGNPPAPAPQEHIA